MYQEEEKNALNPIILIITGVLALVLTTIFFVQVFSGTKKDKYVELTVNYVNSDIEWAKCKDIIVSTIDDNIKEYSFDGGITYQGENSYEVCTNGAVSVKARNEKEVEIGSGSIIVTGIDTITPTIIAKDTKVKVGSTFDLMDAVIAVDNESGVTGDIIVAPTTIDTSTTGIYTFTYTVHDKAGNVGTRLRTITVEE